MARNIDESDQLSSDLDSDRPLTRRERRRLEKAGLPRQSRGEDETPVTDGPEPSSTDDDPTAEVDEFDEDDTEDDPVRSGDVVPAHVRGRRKPWVPALIILIVLALVGAGGYLWWQRSNPAPAPAAAPTVETKTLYISLTNGPDNHSVGGMLLISHGEDAYGVLVPADLTLDVPDVGTTTINQAQLAGADYPARALSDATGVPIDGTWVLSLDGLRSLVDANGGVSVDVDTPVTGDIALQPGRQTLDGVSAATYAGWMLSNEPQVQQLTRSGVVLTAALAALPADQAQISTLLAATPGQTTLSDADLASSLVTFQAAAAGESFGGAVLPTTPAPTVANPNAVALDLPKFGQWLNPLVPGLQTQVPGEAGTAQVKNASGAPDLQAYAREQVLEQGFAYEWGGLAEPVQPTSIVIYSPARDTRAAAQAAASALGLPETAVQASDDLPVNIDVVILLGSDYAAEQGVEIPAPEATDENTDAENADADAEDAEATDD